MNIDDNGGVVNPNLDDLSAFENAFYGRETEEPVKEEAAPIEEQVEDNNAEIEEPVDPLATEEPEEPEIEDEDHDDGKPRLGGKKKGVQERIDEITAARRAAEREAESLRQELERLKNAPKQPEPEVAKTATKSDGRPDPDALNDVGDPIYPLGELDPEYLIAYQDWRLDQRLTEIQERERQQAEEAKRQQETAQLIDSWESKLAEVEAEIPDVRQKGSQLTEAFAYVEPEYGDFLATTLMRLDAGPQVVAYLADNLDEARRIVNAGPFGASLLLGELNGQFKKSRAAPAKPKPTAAPTPPPSVNRGTDGRFSTPGDTDDLAAFEREFFTRKK